MNKIEKLLKELCPNGVEFKALGEIFEIKNGYTPSKANKEFWEGGTIPWFRMDDIRTNGRILSDSLQHITPKALKGGKLFPKNSIIISTTATIGEHALIIVDSLANQQFTFLSKKVNCDIAVDMKFIYYYCFILGQWCKQNTNVSGFASVDMKAFKNFQIPIPPLEVQEEIVKILDTFTELERELESHIKQYEYYRNKLLSLEYLESSGGYELKTLGEITLKVSNIIWSKADKKEYRYIDLSSVSRDIKQILTTTPITRENAPSRAKQIVFKNDVLFATTRPTLSRYCVVDDKFDNEICSTGFCVLRAKKENVLPKWIFYCISTQICLEFLENNQEGTSYPSISDRMFKTFQIPIPPLATQEKIVSILDKFHALTTDLTSGIPAELEARKKQYEYYRNKLLTFKEAR